MLNIPSSVKTLYQTDGVRKNFRVHFPNGEYADITNDNVVQESVKFTESLCSQSTFKFGLAEASVLEFETVGIGNMYGMTIEASIEIDCSSLSAADKAAIAAGTWDGTWDAVNEMFGIPLGTFRVDKCPRNHGAMAHRQVTAYSANSYNLNNLPYLPNAISATSIEVSVNAIIAQLTGDGLTEITSKTPTVSGVSMGIRTQNAGYVWIFSLMKGQHGSGTRVEYWTAISTYMSDMCDFAMFDDYNMIGNYQIGKAAAAAVDALGLGVIFRRPDGLVDSFYADTEEALKDNIPWLFCPCIGIPRVNFALADKQKFLPVLGKKNTSAFYAADIRNSVFYALGNISSLDDLYLQIEVRQSNETLVTTYYADLVLDDPQSIVLPTVRRFTVDTPTPRIYIVNSGALQNIVNKLYWADGGDKHLNGENSTPYNYNGACDAIKLINGATEIQAAFIQRGRTNIEDLIHLDNSAPIAVSPDNYSECWWDEYDVDPIGTVNVTFLETDGNGATQESTTAIGVGGGASRYDMADNEVLKMLGVTLDDVTSLINTYFAPHVGAVAFTPVELTMQGWPWLEAGDALEITAEDGTVVETYALRVEMSGIQHLASVITAEGGEIIEEVS